MAGRAAEHSNHTEGGTDPEPAERDAGSGATVAERVRRAEGGLSPAERKIARPGRPHWASGYAAGWRI
ncbi:hypothetical protein [Streptomyces decoyicus]|uniref:hypothetical protein n=1 Tax=Streptomyces decoyicus TaxID=249567 RepID=UPI00339ED79D